MLEINAFMDNVQADKYEAQQLGVRGGPFFIFDNKYAVSGAQDSTLFLQMLAKGWNEKKRKNCPLTGAFAAK